MFRVSPQLEWRGLPSGIVARSSFSLPRALSQQVDDEAVGGEPEKAERTAAAGKLLLIAHAIYKSGDSYRVSRHEHEFRRNSRAARPI